jgi:hypothetical protein
MMVRIELYPFEIGSLTMKSKAMVWKGRALCTGVMGDSGAFCACVLILWR